MKQKSLLMLLLASVHLFSCTENESLEEECVGDNYTINLDRYLKKIVRTPTDWRALIKTSEFTYDAFNLLEKENAYTFDYDNEHLFNYWCNNNVSEMYGTTYRYNSHEQIISVNTDIYSSYELTYDGQSIHAKGKVFIDPNQSITLEMNSENLVGKIARADSYSTFEYDVNGNLTGAKDFDQDGVLLKAYEIVYDENPNPFYHQLNSTYVVRFIEFFYESAATGLMRLIIYDFDSFRFPFFTNNALTIRELTNPSPYNLLLEREFEYDDRKYPVKIKFTFVGLHQSDYEIEYY